MTSKYLSILGTQKGQKYRFFANLNETIIPESVAVEQKNQICMEMILLNDLF